MHKFNEMPPAMAAQSLLTELPKRDTHPFCIGREGKQMERANTQTAARNERLATIVDRCLDSQSAYKLFDMLASISQLEMESKIEYIDLVRESGVYTDEEISAIERLIVSGTAQYFKDVIDQVRDEQVQREISDMVI